MLKRIIRKVARMVGLYPRPVTVTAEIKTIQPQALLKDKRIVITGGTKGLGLAMAKKFVSEGAKVLITGRDEDKAKTIAASIGAFGAGLNLCDFQSFDAFVDSAAETLGGIDCLVNNAGVSLHEAHFEDVTPETFDTQVKTNLEGPFFLTQRVVKQMRASGNGGNILFVSSETGFTADIRPYGLTKAAINSLVQGLAYLLVKDGIRVNAIAPGVVATEMTGYSPEGNLHYNFNSIGRLYLPEEIAEAACYLVSDVSGCISGQIIGLNNARTVNARWK